MIHTFKAAIATKIGIFPAVLLNYIHYRQKLNREADLMEVFIEGAYWMFTTPEKLVQTYPYIEPEEVVKVVDRLEAEGYLKKRIQGKRVFLAVANAYFDLLEKTEAKF